MGLMVEDMATDKENEGKNGIKEMDSGLNAISMELESEEKENEEKNGTNEIDSGLNAIPMELESELKGLVSGFADKIKKYSEYVEMKKNAMNNGDDKRRNEYGGGHVKVDARRNPFVAPQGENADKDENSAGRKRNRECYSAMLNWIVNVAKDPCNPAIRTLPESHKWKNYGSELLWKQTLTFREAMRVKGNADASSQQAIWQKKQKMDPRMYDDQVEKLRYSQRLVTAKDSSRKAQERFDSETSSSDYQSDKQFDSPSDPTNSKPNNNRPKRIPIGPSHQADIPELVSPADYQHDPRWLGTRIWPLDKEKQNRGLIERDPIGKGRQESCGCQFPGSTECVRFHVREKRMKVKLELGSAFYLWKFNFIGEDVALSWTPQDEKKFEDIVKTNRLSMGKCYWDELFKIFPSKGREVLVSYYFNVFLARCRGYQNRIDIAKIDSDDEDSAYGPIANRFGQGAKSIFCSPKKSNYNSR